MDSDTLYSVIQELDSKIGQLKCCSGNEKTLSSLLELRNNLLIKYKPNCSFDWSIINKQAQQVLMHFKWTAVYKD